MWSKVKNIGDDWVYPKPLIDLSGWNLRCMHSGNMHHFVGTKSSCTSWDHAQHGELGYDPNAQKSIPIYSDLIAGNTCMEMYEQPQRPEQQWMKWNNDVDYHSASNAPEVASTGT